MTKATRLSLTDHRGGELGAVENPDMSGPVSVEITARVGVVLNPLVRIEFDDGSIPYIAVVGHNIAVQFGESLTIQPIVLGN